MSKVKKFCTNCGTPNINEKNFCTHCGTSLVIEEASEAIKAKAMPAAEPEVAKVEKQPNPKKKHKKLPWIIALIVLLFIAGGAGATYYFYPNIFHPMSAEDVMQGTWYGMSTDGVSHVKNVEKLVIKGKKGSYTQIAPDGTKTVMDLVVDTKAKTITATQEPSSTTSLANTTSTSTNTAPTTQSKPAAKPSVWHYTVKDNKIEISSGADKNLTVEKVEPKKSSDAEKQFNDANLVTLASNLTTAQANQINNELAKWYAASKYGKGMAVAEDSIATMTESDTQGVVINGIKTPDGQIFLGLQGYPGSAYQKGTFAAINAEASSDYSNAGASQADVMNVLKDYHIALLGVGLQKDGSGQYSTKCGFSAYQLKNGKTGLIQDQPTYLSNLNSQGATPKLSDLVTNNDKNQNIYPATNGKVYLGGLFASDSLKLAPSDVQAEYKKLIELYSGKTEAQMTKGMNYEQIYAGDFSSILGTWKAKDGTTYVITKNSVTILESRYGESSQYAYTYGKAYQAVGGKATFGAFTPASGMEPLEFGAGGAHLSFIKKGEMQTVLNNQKGTAYVLDNDAINLGQVALTPDNLAYKVSASTVVPKPVTIPVPSDWAAKYTAGNTTWSSDLQINTDSTFVYKQRAGIDNMAINSHVVTEDNAGDITKGKVEVMTNPFVNINYVYQIPNGGSGAPDYNATTTVKPVLYLKFIPSSETEASYSSDEKHMTVENVSNTKTFYMFGIDGDYAYSYSIVVYGNMMHGKAIVASDGSMVYTKPKY